MTKDNSFGILVEAMGAGQGRAKRGKIAGIAVIAGIGRRKMNEQGHRNGTLMVSGKRPEAQYAYYRRCQVFRRSGEQCKAPAEKGAYICHAHAGQLALALRRERECRAVLAEAVSEMRRRGKPECEPVDLFMDFKGIEVTLAKMAQALIDGRIDCKTAGRLLVQLQMASKLLWMAEKAKARITAETRRPGEERKARQICADERRLAKGEESPALLVVPNSAKRTAEKDRAANLREETRIGLMAEVLAFTGIRSRAYGPPGSARAA